MSSFLENKYLEIIVKSYMVFNLIINLFFSEYINNYLYFILMGLLLIDLILFVLIEISRRRQKQWTNIFFGYSGIHEGL